MKKLITLFFVTLGVIFFVLICAGSYIWFADPFELRPLVRVLMGGQTTTLGTATTTQLIVEGGGGTVNAPKEDTHPILTPTQEASLKSIGIDPATLPSSITPEQEACFRKKIGDVRVEAIKGGESPTPSEVFSTRSCYGN